MENAAPKMRTDSMISSHAKSWFSDVTAICLDPIMSTPEQILYTDRVDKKMILIDNAHNKAAFMASARLSVLFNDESWQPYVIN